MTTRELFRGDDYVLKRQVFYVELVDLTYEVPEGEDPHPADLSGCTVRMTFKASPTDLLLDPEDETAPVKGDITFDEGGNVTSATLLSLPPGKTAADGELWLTMDRAATANLPADVTLSGDLQVTDALDEDTTIPVIWQLVGRDSFTNRRNGGTP